MHSKLAADMFVLSLPIAEKILRPIVVYVFLIVGLRLAGRRELAQLQVVHVPCPYFSASARYRSWASAM